MYQENFGTKEQISFNSEAEYYELLGYLSKSDGATILVWEDNDLQGAWAKEGRILFFEQQPLALRAKLLHTAGVGNIVSRVNCNEFILNIRANHHFVLGETQSIPDIKGTVPKQYISDFEAGLQL
ncbi:hypothetical protein [Parapedobacter soli]|uniref:hypothetical protein n=1 Tax=Parapedobacter soli TaxID=416955 RepID=UPI0021C99D19|nr:hypothetical protein [Parapedobacter soli]